MPPGPPGNTAGKDGCAAYLVLEERKAESGENVAVNLQLMSVDASLAGSEKNPKYPSEGCSRYISEQMILMIAWSLPFSSLAEAACATRIESSLLFPNSARTPVMLK